MSSLKHLFPIYFFLVFDRFFGLLFFQTWSCVVVKKPFSLIKMFAYEVSFIIRVWVLMSHFKY